MLSRSSFRWHIPAVLAAFVLFVAAPAAAAEETQTNQAPPAKAAPSKAPSKAPAATGEKPKAKPPDPDVMEKEFTITLINGMKVKCQVFPNPDWPGKIVKFDPSVPSTDVNLHNAALNSMWEVYGRQRGSFKVEDANLVVRPDMNNARIVVYKLKTGARFCVYPVREDASKTLQRIGVWME